MFQRPDQRREGALDPGMDVMRILLGAIAAAISMFLCGQTPAAAQAVNCPITTVQRGITNSLPSGWYTTPVRSRLTETRVMNIGGQQTMACVYGEAATVLREIPASQICSARSGGFECGPASEPAPTPTSEVYASGTFSVRGTYDFDLDAGAEAPRTTSQFWYEVIRDGETYFTPRRGARIAAVGGSEPGYSGCTSATLTSTRTRIETTTGGWFCYRTNEGRIGQFHVDGVNRFSRPIEMTITYATW
ncbi:hypothetical protein ATE48_05485 [Candidatus Viadribacter manganicus]|uniref:Uncharacterized protein n=2 Tax=Candidatus Viadribacter manganicus TaxID=1759059 RepID=A0A1B1AFU5_9PROT|nr:hypothetical protein ATE48_05485 [Candidatus Viadribacter manganicus]